jgi:hypothetical protein
VKNRQRNAVVSPLRKVKHFSRLRRALLPIANAINEKSLAKKYRPVPS